MGKILKILVLIIYLAISILSPLYFVQAGTLNLGNAFQETGPLGNAALNAGYNTKVTDTNTVFSVIINVAISFVGVIFLVLMIYGGYLWMTARGNEQQVEKAKNLIIAAVIGLIIVLAAYAISAFILSKIGAKTLIQP